MAALLECGLSVAFLPGVRLSVPRLALSTDLQGQLRQALVEAFDVKHAEQDRESNVPSSRLLYSASSQSAVGTLPEPYWTGLVPLLHDEYTKLTKAVKKRNLVSIDSPYVQVSLYDFDVAVAHVFYTINVTERARSSMRLASSSIADDLTYALTPFCARFSATLSDALDKSPRLAPLRIPSLSKTLSERSRSGDNDQQRAPSEQSTHASFSEQEPAPKDTSEGAEVRHPNAPLWNHALYVQSNGHLSSWWRPSSRPALDINDFTLVPGLPVSLGSSTFVPGLHASLLTTNSKADAPRVARVLSQLHAWWTGTWLLDQHLLDAALLVEMRSDQMSLAELEASARGFAETAQIVDQLKARYDTNLLNLGSFEWAIWQALASTWNFHHNLESVQRKSDNALTAHNVMRAEISARQSHRFNRIAAVFTLIATLSSLIAVLVFLAPAVDDETTPLTTKLAILAVLVVCGSLALTWSFSLALAARRRRPGGLGREA